MLTAGSAKINMNPRIRIIPVEELRDNVFLQNSVDRKSNYFTSYNLELRDLKTSDAGDYACQIGTTEPIEIVHRLEVLVPPKIDYVSPAGGRIDVNKGSSLRLECRAKGNPSPKIVWMRKVRVDNL